jgi:hypothetical protein
MTFQQWIKGFESRYTKDELWTIKWAFEVGSRKAQPVGTFVSFEALMGNATYEVVQTGEIVHVSPLDGHLYRPSALALMGLRPVEDWEMEEFKRLTFMRVT